MAAKELKASGIPVGLCITPTLPVADVPGFVRTLADFAPDVLVTQDFHDAGGKFGADTGEQARKLLATSEWNTSTYQRFVEALRETAIAIGTERGQHAPRTGALDEREHTVGLEQRPHTPQRVDFVAEVMQHHRRPHEIGLAERVEAVGKVHEAGFDPHAQRGTRHARRGAIEHRV